MFAHISVFYISYSEKTHASLYSTCQMLIKELSQLSLGDFVTTSLANF